MPCHWSDSLALTRCRLSADLTLRAIKPPGLLRSGSLLLRRPCRGLPYRYGARPSQNQPFPPADAFGF